MSSVPEFAAKLVNTSEGDMTTSLTVNPNEPVSQLKVNIKKVLPNIDIANITLSFNGKILADKDIPHLVGMKQGSKISMSIQVRGG